MNREIKFRALELDTGVMRFGFYIAEGGVRGIDGSSVTRHKIFDGLHREIAEDTLGQFTGLSDKNDIEIYEGDISPYLECSRQGKINAQVYYCTETSQFRVKWIDGGVENFDSLDDCTSWFEVIGNKFENPELIK